MHNPLRVLVVDDCPDTAQTLAWLLELWGHETRLAHDGPGGLAAARRFRPDVVLLDIGLPGMDGFEVARELRRREDLRELRLVGLTGFGHDDYLRRSQDAGFDHYLVKPVEPQQLKLLLAECQPLPPSTRHGSQLLRWLP